MLWPLSPEALDAFLFLRVSSDSPHVVDAHHPGAADRLVDELKAFLQRNRGSGHFLVKTSTTGGRPASHEVSTGLMTRVLGVVAGVCGPASVVLGDGPVFEVPYKEECERLGWKAAADDLGLQVRDLNRDASVELAPGWAVSKTFREARAVINLTRAKTHRRFGVSLAEKALLGVLSGERHGHPKLVGRHNAVPWLLDRISEAAPPIFSIIEGVEGIEGFGPLGGTATHSHFLCFGTGCLAPDVRAVVEMGFDPVLVPSFHRPFPDSGMRRVRWPDLRVTDVDFEPARTCPWLYRSLGRSWGRGRKFATLQRGVREDWPVDDPA